MPVINNGLIYDLAAIFIGLLYLPVPYKLKQCDADAGTVYTAQPQKLLHGTLPLGCQNSIYRLAISFDMFLVWYRISD